MKITAWMGTGLCAIAAVLLFGACDDYEFSLEECTESWDCRTNFGVGYTCSDEGYCVAPEKAVQSRCEDTSLNFPPEIFGSSSARQSVTLGVLANFTGSQLAYATRLAAELSDIRGGLRGSTSLADYNFTAVSCVLRGAEAQDADIVRETARFLRNDVRAEAILIGLDETGTDEAINEIVIQDEDAGEDEYTLIISANDGGFTIESQMESNDQVWTMATSQRNILHHVGEQLVLRRLQPYAMEICLDELGVASDDGRCANVDIETTDQLLAEAYDAYINDPEVDEELGHFVVKAMVSALRTTGQSADIERTAALTRGVKHVLRYLGVPETDLNANAVNIAYENIILGCGSNCGPRQMQIEFFKAMGCDGASMEGDGTVAAGCGQTPENITDAILILSDSERLVDSTYNAFIGTNGADADPVAETLAEVVGVSVNGSVALADANTIFLMPAVASSASTSVYSSDWSSASSATLDNQQRWFSYIREGRIIGVRQSARKDTSPFQSFLSAQEILVDQPAGSSQHYIAQAYDAAWLAMAAIAGNTAAMEQDRSLSAAEQLRILRQPSSQTHTVALRKHFSGATPRELAELDVQGAAVLEERSRDLLPTEWKQILDIGDGSGTGDGIANYPFLRNTFLFHATSGALRFAAVYEDGETVDDAPYGGRERVSYDYGIWMPTIQNKLVAEAGMPVDLDARDCIFGMIAPLGFTEDDPNYGAAQDKYLFVCPVEATVCSYTEDSEEDICVPMHETQQLPYAFPVPNPDEQDPIVNP